MKSKNIKIIIFDVDGTLLDMKDYLLGSYSYTFLKHKLGNITWEKLTPLKMGYPLIECYQLLTGKKNVDLFCKSHQEFQINNLNLVRIFPNTLRALRMLRKWNIKIVALTSRSKKTSIKTLKQAGIYKYFDIIISREDVSTPKPNPEGLIKALGELKVPKEHACMVGDTASDVQTGKNAGVMTIGAAYGFLGSEILKSNPDYVINDVLDVINIVMKR